MTRAGVGTNRYAYSFNDPVNNSDPNGNVCTSTKTRVSCNHPDPDVPSLDFPRPEGWPDEIEDFGLFSYEWATTIVNPYHDYDHEYEVEDYSAEEIMSQAIINPTPGAHDLPATGSGVVNSVGFIALNGWTDPNANPVISYSAELSDGSMAVVNITLPGHELHPGYIVQFATERDGNVIFHVAGEGFARTQSNLNGVARIMERRVWKEQLRQFIEAINGQDY